MQTPILIGDTLYGCDDRGTLTCFDATTGQIYFSERLPGGGFTASLVSDGEKLYVTSEPGTVWVPEADRSFNQIATNELGANCLATPAIVDGALYFRTQESLIAIGN